MDVARKVIILARECGLQVSLDSLVLESLVPEPLAQLDSVDEFMAKMPEVGLCLCVCVGKASPCLHASYLNSLCFFLYQMGH